MTDRMAVLRRLAAQNAAPWAITAQGLESRFADRGVDAPAKGQVWRARWNEDTLLVLLLDVQDHQVEAVPVTIEPTGHDDRSVVVPASETAFGVDVTVWCALVTTLPFRVLDQILDCWPEEAIALCNSESTQEMQHRIHRRPSPTREDVDLQHDLETSLERLAGVRSFANPKENGSPKQDLRSLVNLPLREIRALLKISQSEVMDVMRASRPLTEEQAQALAGHCDVSVAEIKACLPGLPSDAINEVEHPRWRRAVTLIACRNSCSEAEARGRIAQEAYALAARQSGGDDTHVWRWRVQRYLDAELPPEEF